MDESKKVLRDLDIALGVLALVLLGLFGWISFGPERPTLTLTFGNPDVPPVSEPEPVPEPEDEEEIVRYIVDSHTVVGGQSFSLITSMYWDDMFLWPDLYVLNDMRSEDPDLIYPDEIVDIYNRLGRGDVYTEQERSMILDAYIQVYDRFKALGPEKDDSAWTLLWCGAKYDRRFLDLYAHHIEPEDLEMARRYIAEEGFLD